MENVQEIIVKGIPQHNQFGYKNGFGMPLGIGNVSIYSTYEPCEPISRYLAWKYKNSTFIITETKQTILVSYEGNVVSYMDCSNLKTIRQIIKAWESHQDNWEQIQKRTLYREAEGGNIKTLNIEFRLIQNQPYEYPNPNTLRYMAEFSLYANEWKHTHTIIDENNVFVWGLGIEPLSEPQLFIHTGNGYLYRPKNSIQKIEKRGFCIYYHPQKKQALILAGERKICKEFRLEMLLDISKIFKEKRNPTPQIASFHEIIKMYHFCASGTVEYMMASNRPLMRYIGKKIKGSIKCMRIVRGVSFEPNIYTNFPFVLSENDITEIKKRRNEF